MQATRFIRSKKGLIKVFCLGLAAVFLGFTAMPAMAQNNVITSPVLTGAGPVPPGFVGFLFEPESTIDSLKTVTIWNEIEQLLDNPYLFAVDPNWPTIPVVGNAQGFPSYVTTIVRRRSYLPPGCTYQNPVPAGLVACNDALLPQFPYHPLNYNPTTGEEFRLINPGYPGSGIDGFNLRANCACDPTGGTIPSLPPCTVPVTINGLPALGCDPIITAITVSAGIGRVGPGLPAIDYNSPLLPDTVTCIVTTEVIPPEGSVLCGGDPGEPGYVFGVNNNAYSTPAVPGVATPGTSIVGLPLYDPTPDPVTLQPRGVINARVDGGDGSGGLRKPSLRIPPYGTPAQPGFTFNSAANLAADPAALAPSNENDYIAGATFAEKQVARDYATVLGKALFWDMQLGSDSVQACASCHFKALVDDRTMNQLNPNHLGGDLSFQVSHAPVRRFSRAGKPANSEVVPSDFPLHKLRDPKIVGDPMCVTPVVTSTGVTVCDANNIISTTNDVMSSMGVRFGTFIDIPAPGATAFAGNTRGNSVRPDVANRGSSFRPNDPIPAFRGLRRVEPRNTPSLFSAAMNFDNFWDGRARHDFNGGSVFGAADPFPHVFADDGTGLQATRQIIRFSSLASLATGPALSNFEMSFDGRSWPKIGKKLLQPGVVPLANQLVDPTDSVLGPFSNFPNPGITVPLHATSVAGESGYATLIRHAFHSQLWSNTTQHLNGTKAVCAGFELDARLPDSPPIPGRPIPAGCDPFDGYVLSIDTTGPASPTNTNQFTQMEANMSLFYGLGLQVWGQILIPDNTPFDQMLEANPDAFLALGEAGEPVLVNDIRSCNQVGGVRPCFTESGNFKRDPGLTARLNPAQEGGVGATPFPDGGTRNPATDPDPLLGTDIFHGTNLSLKNPNFRSARCGACHLGASLTDNNIERTHALSLGDFVAEFFTPGVELVLEPLGRSRTISGFLLESELNENGQDAIERFIGSQSLVVNPVDGLAYPDGAFFLDNGVYNLGVTPTDDDIGRGGTDPFGWPLSLAALMLKNLGGPNFEPGNPLPAVLLSGDPGFVCLNTPCDPILDQTGGLFEETAQDQQINPGFEADDILFPQLPAYLGPWTNRLNVGNTHPEMDEVFGGLNTLTRNDMLEGFVDTLGPFNPAGIVNEALNNAIGPLMGTWPVVNRVGRMGSFKAPQLRNVELTAPYFHNGGKLTLRQVVDFYARGGDFPATNGGAVPCDATFTTPHPWATGMCYDVAKAHRDMMIINLREEVQSLGRLNDPAQLYPDGFTQEEALNALVDYLLELTDERVRYEQAPFDHPEMFVPLNGIAPDNTFGRPGFLANLANGMFRQVPAVGAGGSATPLSNFMGVSSFKRTDPRFAASGAVISHFDSNTNIPLPGQQAPVANNDNVTWSRFRSAIAVLVNDFDPDGTLDRSSINIMTSPGHGTVTVMRTGFRAGRVIYTPNAGYHGQDTFTYDVADNQGNRSNVATVTVTVP